MNSATTMSSMHNKNCSCMSMMDSMMESMMASMNMTMMVPYWHVKLAVDYLLFEPWLLTTAGCMHSSRTKYITHIPTVPGRGSVAAFCFRFPVDFVCI